MAGMMSKISRLRMLDIVGNVFRVLFLGGGLSPLILMVFGFLSNGFLS